MSYYRKALFPIHIYQTHIKENELIKDELSNNIEKYVKVYKDYYDKDRIITKLRKQLTTDKAVAVDADGYDKFFLLDGKKLAVENFSMESAPIKKGTPSEFKRIFGKSMANRLVSRVVLNKFIQEVA